MRTNFDFSPYRRSTVGFDRLFNLLEAGARDDDGYPPFDIVKDGEDSYRITLAVAGFRPDEIEVIAQQNQLTVTGKRAEDDSQGKYLHRGIAARDFERRFQLADFIEVGEADFDNGLLSIELKRVVPVWKQEVYADEDASWKANKEWDPAGLAREIRAPPS